MKKKVIQVQAEVHGVYAGPTKYRTHRVELAWWEKGGKKRVYYQIPGQYNSAGGYFTVNEDYAVVGNQPLSTRYTGFWKEITPQIMDSLIEFLAEIRKHQSGRP